MLTDVSQRYSRQYSYHVFHYAFKFNENFPFRIFFFILNTSRFFFFIIIIFVFDSLLLKKPISLLRKLNWIHFKGCDWLPFVWVPYRYRKQRVENNIISHFWFCLPSPLKSPWPSDASHFHKNFLAIHGSMLWWFMNILDMLSCLCFSIWTK